MLKHNVVWGDEQHNWSTTAYDLDLLDAHSLINSLYHINAPLHTPHPKKQAFWGKHSASLIKTPYVKNVQFSTFTLLGRRKGVQGT